MVIDALKHQIDTQKHVLKKLKKQHGTYKNHEHEIDEHLKEVFFPISTKLRNNYIGSRVDDKFQNGIWENPPQRQAIKRIRGGTGQIATSW